MAKINPGEQPVLLQGVKDPQADSDAATKAYVDSSGGDHITASEGLQRVEDDIQIEDGGIVLAKLASNSVGSGQVVDGSISTAKIADDAIDSAKLATNSVISDAIAADAIIDSKIATGAVSTAKLADDAVDADKLNVSGDGTDGQVLSSDGDGSFTWVDQSGGGGGDSITASGGLQRIDDDISIATDGVNATKLNVSGDGTSGQFLASDGDGSFSWLTSSGGTQYTADGTSLELSDTNQFSIAEDGVNTSEIATAAVTATQLANTSVTTAKIAAGAVDTNRLADDAVSDAKIADIAVKERHLDVTNTPTAGQVLTSATDTTQFTWADAGGNTDYNDAPFGNFDDDGSISWSFNATDDPSSEGEVSITDNGAQGYTLRFRTADVDTINSVSVDLFQIGFGSPIAFATYAVADLTIADDFVDVSIINGPLDGDDILATFPADNTALSIIVSVSQFRLPLSSLEDVNIPAPVGTHGLIYDGTNNEWVSSETVNDIANGGHINVSTTAGVATLTFDEKYDLWNGKNDWVQITTGTPTGDNFLYDAGTQTITVPSLAGREVLEILLDARSGMAVHIRQENTTSTPSGFQSGFYQILAINATVTPEQVVIRMLPDASDIFDETEGNTYQYELSILQFVTGGTLDNLTLTGLSDVDVSTPPTDGQVLAYELSSGTFIPADNAGGGGQSNTDYNNAPYGALHTPAISYTYTTETSPVNEGEVSISAVDSPDTGYALLFRKADVDAKFLQSLRYLQIGFGSPITFATYAVSTTTITDVVDPQLVTISVIDGPLAGNDLLASLPLDETALSINVSSNEFENPDLGDLPDVDFSTAPTDGQVLAYELSSDTWKPADDSNSNPDLGDLGDVNTSGVEDGYILRYDSDNLNYRVHSVGDTNRAYGGLDVDMDTGFTVPAATGFHALSAGSNAVASGVESVAIGAETDAVAQGAIAIGNEAQAGFASSTALGENSNAAHTNSTAIGTGATTTEVDEVRLGDGNAHVTVNPSVAGNESEDNQLVSKRWVNNQISDASRVISSTANALENLTIVTASTPWDDYRIVPVDSESDPRLEVHMYEFNANQPQFIFYAGFLSSSSFGTGAGLTTGTIPTFFEEVTNVSNEAEVTNADGDAVTSLGWKYLGHDSATVWQAVSHVYTFDFDWIYPAGNSDGTQNPPDVTSSLELVRLKPLSDNTYDMATNVTVIASSPTSFHNAGSLQPGNTESFTGSYEFAQQTLEDGITNVENGDVFAYRMKIRYKGNGFDGDTNVRLAITESETANFVPQLGIRHVGRDYSLVLENSGDLQWTDHGSAIETTLLLVENTADGPEIPAAAIGIVGGEGISVTNKTINVNLQNVNSGLEFDSVNDLRVEAGNGIELDENGVSVDLLTSVNGSGLVFTSGSLRVEDGDSITRTADGLEVNPSNETNNPLEISGTGDDAGLSLNIDEDGPLSKTTNGLDVILETQGGLAIGSLSSGIEVLLPANSGLQKTATGLSLNAGINELTDVNIGTLADGQILEYDGDTSMWINATASGNVAFTAGAGLSFNSDSTVLDITANIFEYSRLGFTTGDADPDVVAGSTRFIAIGTGGSVGGASSVAIGTNATALLGGSSSLGLSARAEGSTSTAIGSASRAMASNSTALGRSTLASGSSSTAVGDEANATATDATAIGTDSTAGGLRSIAIGQNSNASSTNAICIGNSSSASGVNSIHIGSAVTGTGDRAIVMGSAADAGATPLAIALGERASVTATRGIAIGSSSNSASDTADRVQVTGLNGIAVGRAARVVTAQGIALGDDTRCLATDGTAIGASAQVSASATGSTAIGHNASATIANSTVLGSGTGHRVFAGSNELASAVNQSGDANSISCSINNDFYQTPNNGFNPGSTSAEILRYTQVNDLAIGRFDYRLSLDEDSAFQDGDRWTCNTTSAPMLAAFGYNVGSSAIALGTFVVSGSAYNSAAMGDFWLHPDTTTALVRMSFRVRSVIGTAPARDSYISAQFNIAKF